MKTATWRVLIAAGMITVLWIAGTAGENLAWFDMENCELCCQYLQDPEFINCMETETVKLHNGIVTIYRVAPEKMEQYRAMHVEMRAIMQKKLYGGEVQLCGHCRALCDLVEDGCTREYVPTSTGGLCIITSEREKLREEIWGFYEKDEEMKQKMAPPAKTDKTATEG